VRYLNELTATSLEELVGELEPLIKELHFALLKLEDANLDENHPGGSAQKEALYMRDTVIPAMEDVRDVADRLEKIVAELEAGDLTLDDSLARYEEGVKALKKCYEILRDAEKRVEILLKSDDGELKTAPFEPEEEDEASKKE